MLINGRGANAPDVAKRVMEVTTGVPTVRIALSAGHDGRKSTFGMDVNVPCVARDATSDMFGITASVQNAV